jgi:hypothetical protein
MNRDVWRAHVRRWGYRRTAYASVMSAAEKHLGLHVYYVTTGPRRRSGTNPPPEGVRVGPRSRDEMREAARDPVMDLEPSIVELAFDRGDACNGAVADGKVVAYSFRTNTGSAPHEGRIWVECSRRFTYSYKTCVHPQWRGRRLPTRGPESDAPVPGQPERVVGFVATHNYSSLQRIRRSDAKHSRAGVAGYVDRFGVFVGFRTPGAKRVGFRFVRRPAA